MDANRGVRPWCTHGVIRVRCLLIYFLNTYDGQKGASAEDPAQKTRSSANVCSKLPDKVVPWSVA